ncbi:MAG: class I SAM-dependent methyltransferase [Haloarculaceae archaeon]
MDPHDVRQGWADRSGEYSPAYYAYYGANETSDLLRERFDAVLDPDAAILEVGCSSGRHLAHLYEHGYENLTGIDLNADAFDVMAETYPALADAVTFYAGDASRVVATFEDDRFDAVFSVEALQHFHPDEGLVFADLARVAADRLVTVENEGDDEEVNYVRDDVPLYHRDWERVFTSLGLTQVTSRPAGRDTYREFRPA